MSDLDIYARQGFGGQLRMGSAPALLIVDFVVGFADPAHFGGGNVAAAIDATVPLLGFVRRRRWSVAHTRVVYADDGSDAGILTIKVPSLLALTETSPLSRVVPQLLPREGELILRKQGASAFFGTGLSAWLTMRRVDTVVIAGCTTSGCVRASVVDAMQLNFRPLVATDCVGDRALRPHEANLFDMGQT
jgi:maleamate amidohydrolase